MIKNDNLYLLFLSLFLFSFSLHLFFPSSSFQLPKNPLINFPIPLFILSSIVFSVLLFLPKYSHLFISSGLLLNWRRITATVRMSAIRHLQEHAYIYILIVRLESKEEVDRWANKTLDGWRPVHTRASSLPPSLTHTHTYIYIYIYIYIYTSSHVDIADVM